MSELIKVEPQKKWMRKSTLHFFERNKDAVMMRQVVHLSNSKVVALMSHTFEVISRDAYFINIIAREILTEKVSGKIYQEEEIFGAEQAIHKQFEIIDTYLDRRIKQAETKLELAGHDIHTVLRTTKAYEAFSSSRIATDYLKICTKIDIYYNLNQFLNIAGELSDNLDDAQRALLNNERDARNHFLSLASKTFNRFNAVRKICNAVIDLRKQENLARSERDKQIHENKLRAEEAKKEQDLKKAEEAKAKRLAQSFEDKTRAKEKKRALAKAQNEMNQLATPAAAVKEPKPSVAKPSPKSTPQTVVTANATAPV